MDDTTKHVGGRDDAVLITPWWKAQVPPWTTLTILAAAALAGWTIGIII